MTYSLQDLLQLMARLRDPVSGCPWDIAQTFESIVPSTLEECYELAAAIESQDYPHIADELGDVLFQVIFYAQLGKEQGQFDFAAVVHTLTDKLLRRHPHVFPSGKIEGAEVSIISVDQVKHNWEAIKQEERDARRQNGVLDDVPLALPALPRAQKLQKRAARVGFDWSAAEPVLAKVHEEIAELREAIERGAASAVEEEMGDLLFTCVNLARKLGVDAESSLRKASAKFESRFNYIEERVEDTGKTWSEFDSESLNVLWEQAKGELG